MSKMKHLLRKLHISCSPNDHHRLPDSPSPSPSSSLSSASSSSAVAVASARAADGNADFNLLEEEFQVQLALAISASDAGSREDPESAQIKAAKRMSLGCSTVPDETLVEFLSLQYWVSFTRPFQF